MSSKKDIDNAIRQGTIDKVKTYLPIGTTLYAVVKKVAASGMSRQIAILYVDKYNKIVNISSYVSDILDYKWNDNGSVTMRGCGEDMGFKIVYALGSIIHDDGYAFKYTIV